MHGGGLHVKHLLVLVYEAHSIVVYSTGEWAALSLPPLRAALPRLCLERGQQRYVCYGITDTIPIIHIVINIQVCSLCLGVDKTE